jgi:lysophospholipase L1-like esterase
VQIGSLRIDRMNSYLKALACAAIPVLLIAACAEQPAVRTAAVNTDPARAQVVLPEPANAALPSLILIGDSTVRNGHDDGQGKGAEGQWGWGNPIAAYFDPARINVVNRAVGGLSSRTYLTSGHWERTRRILKPGDVVIMQFGHNDSTAINDRSRARGTIHGTGEESQEIDNLLTGKPETVHSYGWYLRMYIAAIRARGATPIVASPIPRKAWGSDGRVVRARGDYAGWAAEVARQENVGFIDLNEQVARQYEALGRDAVMKQFPLVTPDERVHTNWAGAELNARAVVAGIKALRIAPLVGALTAAGTSVPAAEDDRPVVDAGRVIGEQPRDPRLPSLFLVGDSTVKSGGQNGAIGWGERIAPYFDTSKVNVVNHAIGGRSSRTFFTEGRWDRVLSQLKAGDVVLIQFGHNDGGRIGDPAMKNRASGRGVGAETVEDTRPDGTKEQVHTFGWYMARYVADAKARGAAVVLLSPVPHRDAWEQGRDFATFAEWDQEVARNGGALFADLTMVVSDGYRQLGASTVSGFFSDARTHTNDAGARFNAQRVIAALKALPGAPVTAWLSPESTSIAPALLKPVPAAASGAAAGAASPGAADAPSSANASYAAASQAQSCATWGTPGKLLHADKFDTGLQQWLPEYRAAKGATVAARKGKLLMDLPGDATVWFKPRLKGNVLITYKRRMIMNGGRNDRLSDLNQFWMATDPNNSNLFTRDGTFKQYDNLSLYYVGIGGNSNTTTRFRKYDKGERTLLAENAELLQPNKEYEIQIAVYNGCTRLSVDGKEYFSYRDPAPLREGHFGFRTTHSHQEIRDFKVYQLQ